MKKKISVFSYIAPFGNRLSKRDLFGTGLFYKACKTLYGKGTETIELAAVAEGEAYRKFGIYTIVDKNAVSPEQKNGTARKFHTINSSNSVIIGTIRMGFGHWRIAIALASAAHYMGYTPYMLDLLSFKGTVTSKSINLLENLYNTASRFSQKSFLFNKIWENCTSSGGQTLNVCVRERTFSRLFTQVFTNIPKNIPVLSAHPWVGHAAVLSGMKTVVSIIPDNLPMAFWLVEGSRHTVQSPSACMGYRILISMECKHSPVTKCLLSDDISDTGHYVDYEIVSNIQNDCTQRLKRAAKKKPRRFLLTMGGAGAQAKKFAQIALYCKTEIQNGKACLLINMGDHKGRWAELKDMLDKQQETYTMHTNWEETMQFCSNSAEQQISGIHVFLHDNFYAAVYTTNILMRVCDIMITKPSELSFYPVPKLFIHRVGKHEAWGAIRGAEIGDGTIETDSDSALERTLRELIYQDDLLKMYINHILKNQKAGIYDGARNAVKLAVTLAEQRKI